jgi:predicted ATPase
MKAFLMHKDRDFDAEQLIVRKDNAARNSRRDEKVPDLKGILPWNEEQLRQDLGLDVIFNAMAQGDQFIFDVVMVAMLQSLTDLNTIGYRQHAYIDCHKNAQVIKNIYQITIDAIEGERKHYWFGRYPSGLLSRAIEVLQIFVGALKRLRHLADRHAGEFESEAFSRLLSMLRTELSDEYFAEIEQHLARLKFRSGVLVSARLGKANKAPGYVLRKPHQDNRSWLTRLLSEHPPSYSFQLAPRDEAGYRALSDLHDRGVNLAANALAQSTDHILSFFQMLRTELAFYIGCLKLHEHLAKIDEPICLPVPARAGDRLMSSSELHDVSLALTVGRKVVGNDLKANGKNIVIVTGANTGGKSTFLRSVGVAQLMMQAGMFVSAQSYKAEVCDGILTHYKREEDTAMESGKWDEELKRMSVIVDRIGSNSLILFNESFASTNEREGSEIASHIVDALLDQGVKMVFVTHLYHFASNVFFARGRDVVFLRAERRTDGSRSFKLIEAEPLQTSYGVDLYNSIFGGGVAEPQARNTQRVSMG